MGTADIRAKLDDLRRRPKYAAEPEALYTGIRSERQRRQAEAQLNDLIDIFRRQLPAVPTKDAVLEEFSRVLAAFGPGDTEDRERLCGYLEEVMDIFGIESSDGLLNRWLYGFDPPKEQLPVPTRAPDIRSVMVYLKDGRIYVFTMAMAANGVYTLDRCRAEHHATVSAELLGRDALVLLRMSGRPMTMEEHKQRGDPLAAHFGRTVDARFCKGMGLVAVALPRPTAGLHVGAMQFVGVTPFPADHPAILPNDADADQLGEAIIAKLLQSQQLNS